VGERGGRSSPGGGGKGEKKPEDKVQIKMEKKGKGVEQYHREEGGTVFGIVKKETDKRRRRKNIRGRKGETKKPSKKTKLISLWGRHQRRGGIGFNTD